MLLHHCEIVYFTTQALPSVIEHIGRVRALATYAAASGRFDDQYASKLRFAIQCLHDENKVFLSHVKELESRLGKDFSPLMHLKSYDVKLKFLLKLIESDILTKHSSATDGHHLYTLSTEIMNRYFSTVGKGVGLIAQWHDIDMENWLITQ